MTLSLLSLIRQLTSAGCICEAGGTEAHVAVLAHKLTLWDTAGPLPRGRMQLNARQETGRACGVNTRMRTAPCTAALSSPYKTHIASKLASSPQATSAAAEK